MANTIDWGTAVSSTGVTLTVGTNTYVNLADASGYIDTMYDYAATWAALSADDQARALISATKAIDGLRLQGYKCSDTQALAFPRVLASPYPTSDHDHITYQDAVPQVVIDATCAEAAAIASGSTRDSLRADGVSEYSIGTLKEKLSGGRTPLKSREAVRLLRPYLLRAVPIR